MTNSSPPLIGITLDDNNTSFIDNHFIPSYTLSKNLKTSVLEAGGIPVGIPTINKKNIPPIIEKLDGIILYKIDSSIFSPESVNIALQHNPFEYNLLQICWDKNIPILAIADGMHFMTLFLQGELYSDLQTEYPNSLPHMQINPPYQGSHSIKLQPQSLLYTLTQRTKWIVNSFHYKRIKSSGYGLISAIAEDNCIEAIEDPSKDFFIGVQWHPEFVVDYTDRKLFSALIIKAKIYAQTKL